MHATGATGCKRGIDARSRMKDTICGYHQRLVLHVVYQPLPSLQDRVKALLTSTLASHMVRWVVSPDTLYSILVYFHPITTLITRLSLARGYDTLTIISRMQH